MTETATEKVDLSEHEDSTVRALWAKVQAEEPALHQIYKQIRENSPPAASEIEKMINGSDDPEIKGRREEIARLEAAVLKAKQEAREYVLAGFDTLPDEELKAMRVEFGAKATAVNAVLNLIGDITNTLGIEDVPAKLDEYRKTVPSLRGIGLVSARTVNNGPRPKIDRVEVTKPGKAMKPYDTLSFASTYAGHSTTEVLEAWLKAAGKENWKDVTVPVSFTLGEGDKVIEFTVYPKSTDAGNSADETEDNE